MGTVRRRRRGIAAFVGRVARVAAAVVLAWLALCALGLLYLRFLPPLVTALQLQRWVQYGDRPGSSTGFIPLRTLGPNLPKAVIAAEDSRFYLHHGLDIEGLRQAIEDNMRRGRLWRRLRRSPSSW
jgi:monofunctional biosynthetic peptidoglycan transglycosylase